MQQVLMTRAQAKAVGSKTYFTGIACPKGHISLRRVINCCCVECLHILSRKSRQANKKATNARNRRWHIANRAQVLETQHAWYVANSDRLKAKARENGPVWRKANPDKNAAKERNRRARKKAAEGSHTAADIARIRKLQRDRCAGCRAKLNGRGHVDHIVAIAKGGSNWPSNLQLLCQPCNTSKHDSDPITFMQSRGRLL